MLPTKRYRAEEIAAALWTRRWLVLFPFVTVALVTVLIGRLLPDQYRSEALILVEPQEVPESYIKPTVTTKIEQRLQTITRQILSRTKLESLIQELDLYPEMRKRALMEDVVQRMRDDISVTVDHGAAFRVSYVSTDRTTAMKVTERLAQFFIDENLRDRQQLAQGTSQFLASQLEQARQRLLDQEHRLEEYRRLHAGELPDQLDANLTAVNNTQLQIQSVIDSANHDRDRLHDLQRDLDDLQAMPPEQADEATPERGAPIARLAAAERTLQALKQRLTPQHPDVIRMTRMVHDLEEEIKAAGGSPDQVVPEETPETAHDRKIDDMQDQIAQITNRIARREKEEGRLRGVLRSYQAKAEAAPARGTELIELTRDYGTLQDLYNSLLKKSESSRMAADLENRQIGEQFRLIDAARLPERPFSPNRGLIAAAGAIGGLALGLLLAALADTATTRSPSTTRWSRCSRCRCWRWCPRWLPPVSAAAAERAACCSPRPVSPWSS